MARPNADPAAILRRLRAQHSPIMAANTGGDKESPVCRVCYKPWPCFVVQAHDQLRESLDLGIAALEAAETRHEHDNAPVWANDIQGYCAKARELKDEEETLRGRALRELRGERRQNPDGIQRGKRGKIAGMRASG